MILTQEPPARPAIGVATALSLPSSWCRRLSPSRRPAETSTLTPNDRGSSRETPTGVTFCAAATRSARASGPPVLELDAFRADGWAGRIEPDLGAHGIDHSAQRLEVRDGRCITAVSSRFRGRDADRARHSCRSRGSARSVRRDGRFAWARGSRCARRRAPHGRGKRRVGWPDALEAPGCAHRPSPAPVVAPWWISRAAASRGCAASRLKKTSGAPGAATTPIRHAGVT